MGSYERTIAVAAPPDRVWAVLEDVEAWPASTPSMSSVRRTVDGGLRVGERIRVRQPRLPPAVWTVTRVEPGRSFTWTSRAPGLHSVGDHEIRPGTDGCTLVLRFAQTGPLAGPAWRLMVRTVRRYVDLEAEGLKRRAESSVS
ncbi:SRPBCC family protein [Pseudonocardia sp. NPDC049154]|uniref:SRPBCC family protein n=1 Tax=Pseudonocardia sp. NPDC049154 TaxID=3155501 RepID=UPI0033CCBF94